MNSFHRSHGWVRRLQGTAETKPAWFQPGPAADVRCVDFPAWHHHAAEFRKLLRARKSLCYIGVVYHGYSDPRSCVHNFILKGTSRRSRVINLSQISPTIPTLTPAKRPTAMWIRGSTEMESCRNSWKCMINAASRSTVFQHQNVSPNSFNIETPTKTHLAPVFWTTVLLNGLKFHKPPSCAGGASTWLMDTHVLFDNVACPGTLGDGAQQWVCGSSCKPRRRVHRPIREISLAQQWSNVSTTGASQCVFNFPVILLPCRCTVAPCWAICSSCCWAITQVRTRCNAENTTLSLESQQLIAGYLLANCHSSYSCF